MEHPRPSGSRREQAINELLNGLVRAPLKAIHRGRQKDYWARTVTEFIPVVIQSDPDSLYSAARIANQALDMLEIASPKTQILNHAIGVFSFIGAQESIPATHPPLFRACEEHDGMEVVRVVPETLPKRYAAVWNTVAESLRGSQPTAIHGLYRRFGNDEVNQLERAFSNKSDEIAEQVRGVGRFMDLCNVAYREDAPVRYVRDTDGAALVLTALDLINKPYDVIRQHLQVDVKNFEGIVDYLRNQGLIRLRQERATVYANTTSTGLRVLARLSQL